MRFVPASATILMKPSFSPFSTSYGRGHGPFEDYDQSAALVRLRLAPPHAPERRIDVERLVHRPLAHLSILANEQVRSDNLEIVIGGVRKGPAARSSD
jgi:hypothetical protein